MHNFDIISNKILLAEMFGFHFVDDADISVECDVMICRESDNSEKCRLKQVITLSERILQNTSACS